LSARPSKSQIRISILIRSWVPTIWKPSRFTSISIPRPKYLSSKVV